MFDPVVVAHAHLSAIGAQQLPFVMAPAVARLVSGQRDPSTRETLDRLERPQRTVDPGGADLELIPPGDGLVHVEAIGEPTAEPRAVSYGDASRLVEKDANDPVVALRCLLDIHDLVTGLLGQGLGKLANFFSDFQFRSG